MDLLANYGSSDEEEENPSPNLPSKPSFFSSLPNPNNNNNNKINQNPNSILSSLPPPTAKKIIKINHPLIKPKVFDDSDDEDNEIKKEKNEKLFTKTPSFFSNIPAPKIQNSTLGSLSSGLGSGRKSILDTNVLSLKEAQKSHDFGDKKKSSLNVAQVGIDSNKFGEKSDNNTSLKPNFVNYSEKTDVGSSLNQDIASFGEKTVSLINSEYDQMGFDPNNVNYGEKLNNGQYSQVNVDPNNMNYSGNLNNEPSLISLEYNEVGIDSNNVNYSGYLGDGSSSISGNNVYGNYDYYAQQYNNNNNNTWGDNVMQSGNFGVGESVLKVAGKRGRNEIPMEIVEVKQDDLTKNRPREDQAKSTGIAFGPAYQPVSTKGKPSKLMKRKHQIGALYFDMRQKESELAERRSKGFLTKAETQAKYGW